MSSNSQNNRGQERPEHTKDQHVETAVEDTFPASDPAASTASQGSRAVPPEEMMEAAGSKPPPCIDAVEIVTRFADRQSAKLALETLVRDGPIDRRCAEMVAEGGGVLLRLSVPRTDADRLRGLLEHSPSMG